MKEGERISENWWTDLYDDLLAGVLLEGTDTHEIHRTVSFLKNALELSSDDLVFDQCCGTGRISVALADQGFRVLGIDLIESYVESAVQKAKSSSVEIDFEAADAFEFRCPEPCAGALNWWTSFGYASSDLENIQMLERAFESIRPGGKYALDFMNVPGVIHHFKPEVVSRGQSATEGEILLTRTSEIDVAAGMMKKVWSYKLESGRRVEHRSAVRMYDPPTLARLFKEAGFRNILILYGSNSPPLAALSMKQHFDDTPLLRSRSRARGERACPGEASFVGDLDASAITLDSPRCIIVGQRPIQRMV